MHDRLVDDQVTEIDYHSPGLRAKCASAAARKSVAVLLGLEPLRQCERAVDGALVPQLLERGRDVAADCGFRSRHDGGDVMAVVDRDAVRGCDQPNQVASAPAGQTAR
ncbi:hypothetical protein [Actinacidiphila rubida]|uniref:hypothetical protein n=1 Tax=Actinacidiphila rubida TaxID=310780 RepID=UPI000849CE2D|nr:hypothetical protein [Actinacidiphila rubida]